MATSPICKITEHDCYSVVDKSYTNLNSSPHIDNYMNGNTILLNSMLPELGKFHQIRVNDLNINEEEKLINQNNNISEEKDKGNLDKNDYNVSHLSSMKNEKKFTYDPQLFDDKITKEKIAFETNIENKTIQKVKLNDFFPNSSNEAIVQSKNSLKINFYDLNKDYLSITKLKLPQNSRIRGSHQLFCNFNHIISNLDFVSIIYDTPEINFFSSEVILYQQHGSNKKFFVKRYLHNVAEKTYEHWQPFYENIIRTSYREYALMKLFSLCPFSVNPTDIQFAYIENYSFVIVELLMDYGGNSLKAILDDSVSIDIKDTLKYFRQLVVALNYLEINKVTHNDIKPENILLDLEEDESRRRVRLIDFNIGDNLSTVSAFFESGLIKGYTPAYAAPEIAKLIKKNNKEEINRYFSQIYSLGLVSLFMLRVFENDSMKELNAFKQIYLNDPKKYEENINNKFNEFLIKIKGKLDANDYVVAQKIMKLTKVCLSYEQNQRLTSYNLLKILDPAFFDQHNLEEIEAEINKCLKDQLKDFEDRTNNKVLKNTKFFLYRTHNIESGIFNQNAPIQCSSEYQNSPLQINQSIVKY